MAFNMDAFINTMIHGDQTERITALDTFYNSQLTHKEKHLYREKTTALFKEITKESPAYRNMICLLALTKKEGIGCAKRPREAAKLFKEAIALGDPLAMNLRANMYIQARNGQPNYAAALQLLKQAADLKHPRSITDLGMMYEKGLGVAQSYGIATQYYEQAIVLNDPQAMNNRGEIYEVGKDGNFDQAEAARLYTLAIAQNNPAAMSNRADMHLYMNETDKGIALYNQAIELNYSVAMIEMADLYENEGTPKGYAKAIKLYNRAMHLNNSSAMNNRAMMHERGLGGPKNYAAAKKLYNRAIKLGDAAAMINLALMHEEGVGGPVNKQEAIRLYQQAIVLGEHEAMYNLACLYYQNKQYLEAIPLYNKAIEANCPDAMIKRATMYAEARGGPQNYNKAIILYEKAMKLNATDAFLLRAAMYEKGLGTPINLPAAIEIYEKLVAQNNTKAMCKLAEICTKEKSFKAAIAFYERAIFLGDHTAISKRAEMYKKGQGSDVDLIHYRVLDVLTLNTKNYPKKPLLQEDSTFFNLLLNYDYSDIKPRSFKSLARALALLKNLPQDLLSVKTLKNRIIKAIEDKIIPNYPIHEEFHQKIAHMDACSVTYLMYLIEEHSRHCHDSEGFKEVFEFLTYKKFAESDDPYALNTLKIFAKIFPEAHYWLGMRYLQQSALTSNRSRNGLFDLSERQKAIKSLLIAAQPSTKNEATRKRAQEQLVLMGIVLKKDQVLITESKASDEPILTPKEDVKFNPAPAPSHTPAKSTETETEAETEANFYGFYTYPLVPLLELTPDTQTAQPRTIVSAI